MPLKNAVCMHEVDQGIGWKHTNWRNGHSSVVRDRQLVIQCTATVANYEYVLAFILDQAANLHVEVKATGIVSTMPIGKGVSSPWGTTVAPGVLAVNHQHIFCVRIDPNIDDGGNSIQYDDCVPIVDDPDVDPFGCGIRVESNIVAKPGAYDLDVSKSRTFKIINPSHQNPVSHKPVGYKLHALPSQMIMMGPHTFNNKRGVFASRPIWVTKYRDGELWAAGEFTNQSREDTGLAVWSSRKEDVRDTDVVLWHSFGVTHVTRPEGKSRIPSEVRHPVKLGLLICYIADFPVMPSEKLTISLKPTSFFDHNPSNDVPRSNQTDNKSTLHDNCCVTGPDV